MVLNEYFIEILDYLIEWLIDFSFDSLNKNKILLKVMDLIQTN